MEVSGQVIVCIKSVLHLDKCIVVYYSVLYKENLNTRYPVTRKNGGCIMGEERFVKIASARTSLEAEQIVRALKEKGIVAYRQSGIMDVYMGNSMEGEDIMTAEKDAAAARELLRDYQPGKSDAVPRRWESRGQRMIGWVMLAVIVLCIVVPLIFL